MFPSFIGIATSSPGNLAKPDILLGEDFYEADYDYVQLYIVRNWDITIKQLNSRSAFKSKCLNFSIAFFIVSLLLFAIAVIYKV
ncbi:hypothetical protein [Thalassoporum mexicanum]|uniref:hypothetical protein n=1 Tax=Thalassoporum mexicanum TaxID=3457544 RepID=UPI0005A156A1|nr:hypothetical protein [Pseudanabaena sp. PCC 7367]